MYQFIQEDVVVVTGYQMSIEIGFINYFDQSIKQYCIIGYYIMLEL